MPAHHSGIRRGPLLKGRFMVPVGKDDGGYFSILEKYADFIGGVYLAWPGAPSARAGFAPSAGFFRKVYKWCVRREKIFNILFNAEAHDFRTGFDYKAVNLSAFRGGNTALTFTSAFLAGRKNFRGFTKGISANYRINTVQQLHSLRAGFPEMSFFTVDRDINRDHAQVSRLTAYARSSGLRADLMLNEGCIPFCRVKKDHNTFVTLSHFSDQRENIREVKQACLDFFTGDNSNILKSPFLTRELLGRCDAGFFKVVGRDIPVEMLEKILGYYIHGEPADIGIVFPVKKIITGITTDMLPFAFHKKILNCKNECYRCDYCPAVYKKTLSSPRRAA